MILSWLLYASAIALLLAATAALAEAAGAVTPSSRRWLWFAAMGASVALPLLSLVIPRTALSVGIWSGSTIAASNAGPAGFMRAVAGLDSVVLIAWLLVSVGLAAAMLSQLVWLGHHRRTWRPVDLDGISVLVAREMGPAVIGIRRTAIVVPEWFFALDRETRRLILLHEREHVRARDLGQQLIAGLLVAAFPWNAGLWWQYRRLRLAAEMDCDRRVLRTGVDASAYARTLLLIAERCRGTPRFASALIGTAPMLRLRIADICAPARPRRRLIGCLACACAVLAITAGCLPPAWFDALPAVEGEQSATTGSPARRARPQARFTPDPPTQPTGTRPPVTARQQPDGR